MKNYSVIEKAAKIVIDSQEASTGTSMPWEDAYKGVSNWYNNTDITSPTLLAACVLKFGITYMAIGYQDILEASKQITLTWKEDF